MAPRQSGELGHYLLYVLGDKGSASAVLKDGALLLHNLDLVLQLAGVVVNKVLPEKYDNIICLQTLEHLENPEAAMHNLIDAAKKVLIVGVPFRNRRPDENHIWSFTQDDFSELTDSYCLDKRQRNIYWLVDKQEKGINFFQKSSPGPGKFIAKLFKSFT